MPASNPERISMKTVYSIHDDEEDDPLQKQFKSLEMEWDSIKQSISRSNRRTSPTIAGDHSLFHLYDDSPKQLMALLQNENTPSKQYSPNSGLHDQPAIEAIEQQEADFDDGILRGRRLFAESEVGSDDNGGIHGECFDVDQKSEVCTEFSFEGFENYDGNCNRLRGFRRCCTDSPPSGVAERGGVVVAVKRGGGAGGGCPVGKWFISVVIMLFALAIVAFECSTEHKNILVPT